MEPVLVALVAAAPGLITALASLRRHEKTQKRIEASLGTPNGMGNVVQMQEATLRSLGRLEARHDATEQRVARIENHLAKEARQRRP